MRERLGGFFRLNPLLGGALAAVAGVVTVDVSLPLAVATGVVAFLIAAWWVGPRAAIFVLACAFCASGSLSWRKSERAAAATFLLTQTYPNQRVTGTLLADARPSQNGWTGMVKLNPNQNLPTAKVWWVGEGAPPVEGAEVRARGNFVKPREMRNPGEFDQRQWLDRQGVAAVFLATRMTGEVRTNVNASRAAWVRKGFREAVTTGLPEKSREAAVIRAVVLGEYPRDEDELIAAFRDSGTLHAFSVSGMHVAMVGGIGWLVLGWCGVSRRMAVPLLIVLMFGYSWLSGNSPPAVRSAWMGSVFLLAFLLRRQPNLLNSLGAVLLVTACWGGWLLFLPGVQLSYGVVAAIGLLGGVMSHWMRRFVRHDPYLPSVLLGPWQKRWFSFKRSISDQTAVAGVAWIGSTPLTLYHFGMTTPVAIFAAIPMTIVIWFLLVLSLVAAALYPVSPFAARVVNQGNGKVAALTIQMAERFAAMPFGNWKTRSQEPTLTIYDLDHGAGAACFTASDGVMLLDCGDRRGFRRSVLPSLKKMNAKPDAVILSHADAGHVGGGEDLLVAYPIRQVLLPVQKSRSTVYRHWLSQAPSVGAKLLDARTGAKLPAPAGAEIEVLYTPDSVEGEGVADDRVMIFRLHWQGWRILFVNDAGLKTERRLLSSGVDLKSDVLIAGRHRRDLSLGEEFIQAVAPRAMVVGNADYPPEERRDPEQITWWRERGIVVFDQLASGAVTVHVSKDGALELEGFVNGETQRLTRH